MLQKEIKYEDLVDEDLFALPERLSPVDFCEKNRWLSSVYSPSVGYWNVSGSPHLAYPMECFADSSTREISLMFASQCQKTTFLENCLFYAAVNDPGPCLVVLPTRDAVDKMLKGRFAPTIEETPLFRECLKEGAYSMSKNIISLKRMPIYFGFPGSEVSLASFPCRYLIIDESDKMPRKTKHEASPYSQAKRRTRQYGLISKILDTSTPTDYDGHIYQQFSASCQHHWHVLDPGSGEWVEWDFDRIKCTPRPKHVTYWEYASEIEDGAVDVWYEFQSGEKIRTAGEKNKVNSGGKWVMTRRGKKGHMGFQTGSIVSGMTTFPKLLSDYFRAVHDWKIGNHLPMMGFVQHEKGKPFKMSGKKFEEGKILERVVDRDRGVVDESSNYISVGVDVQWDGCFFVVLSTHDPKKQTCHVVDHGYIEGRPGDCIQELSEARYKFKGNLYGASRIFVDSGDSQTMSEVYAGCRNAGTNCYPIKGTTFGITHGEFYKWSTKKDAAHKGRLCLLSVSLIKDLLKQKIDLNLFSFHRDVAEDDDFVRQLVSEQRVVKMARGVPTVRWEMRFGFQHNHYLDALCYALAASITDGMLNVGLKDVEKRVVYKKRKGSFRRRERE